MSELVTVLSNEESYSSLEGCVLVELSEDYLQTHDDYNNDGRLVSEFVAEAPYVEFEDEELISGNSFFVVLSDGDSISDISGCYVVELPDGYSGDEPIADGIILAEF